jgi:serine/threonine protein kinase
MDAKVVSRRNGRFVEQLQKRVEELAGGRMQAEQYGFLFPLNYVSVDDDGISLVMPEVKPLDTLRVSSSEFLKLNRELFCFLDACRKWNVVHGDLKLGNMGLTDGGSLVVFDCEEEVRGTKGYQAPELRSNTYSTPNFESDLYPAGVILEKHFQKN